MTIVEHGLGELTCGIFEVLEVNAHGGEGFISARYNTTGLLCSATGEEKTCEGVKGKERCVLFHNFP
jgi:hypothetical protein